MRSGVVRASFVCLCSLILLAPIACKRKSASPQESAKQVTETSGHLRPENVIFITLDTVRADHLHCYGDEKIQTPNIDALAARGVVFDKAVTQAPLTLPSHASMFTGTNPNVHHVRDTGGFALQSSSVTLAHILQQRGWNTAAFVSSVVLKKMFGLGQGFTTYDDALGLAPTGVEMERRSASDTVNHAINWMNDHPAQPAMMWLHFYDAHSPFDPPPAEFRNKYPGNTYDAEIAYIDQQVGRFLNAVKQKYPDEKTMVVLLTDHGEDLGQHGEYHHGVFLYDATVKIAWIMAGPGIPAGKRIEQQARTIDVLPTILDLLGGKASPSVQGVSMVPAFSGKQVDSNFSYEETLYGKLVNNWAPLRGIHTVDWMYIRAPKPELYDLKNDPGEIHNVIQQYPKKYRELDEQLKLAIQAGGKNANEIVSAPADAQTMAKLRSLGYAGGSVERATLLDNSGPDPKDMLPVMKLEHQAEETNSPQQKISYYQQALSLDPTNPSIYYELADQLIQTHQYDQATQVCLQALAHGVKDNMILSRLGRLALNAHDPAKAIQYYQEAVKHDPIDTGTHQGLASAYAAVGRIADAQREYQAILAMQPYPPAYSGLGLLDVRQRNFSGARTNFEHALQIDPHFAEAQLNLGVLCMQTGDAPCARQAFHQFLADAPPGHFDDMIPKVHNALNTVLAERK